MNTRDTIERYFDRFQQKSEWQALLADNVAFTSFTIPNKQVSGKDAYLQATKGFYSMIRRMELRNLIVDGNSACALTHYELQPPNGGPAFQSDVAEVFTVTDGTITSLEIYFDSAAFPK